MEVDTCHMPINWTSTFTTSAKDHKVASRLSQQWFTPSFNVCPLRLTDVSDTASGADQRILSELLRKMNFRMLSDRTRLVTIGSGRAE